MVPPIEQRQPLVDHGTPMQRHQPQQLCTKVVRLREQMAIFLHQEIHAFVARDVHLDARRRGAQRGHQRFRQRNQTDAPAFRLDEHRPCGIEAAQRRNQCRIERFLRRLRPVGHGAEQRTAMPRQPLEIERLRPGIRQCMQQARLAATGVPGKDNIVEPGRQRIERSHHIAPVGLVTAFELTGAPADHVHHQGHRRRARSTAPAIDERPPVARPSRERRIEMVSDIACDHGRADPRGVERRDLLVQGADGDALLVAEYRRVDRTGNVVVVEFERCAHVDDFVELVQVLQRNAQVVHRVRPAAGVDSSAPATVPQRVPYGVREVACRWSAASRRARTFAARSMMRAAPSASPAPPSASA